MFDKVIHIVLKRRKIQPLIFKVHLLSSCLQTLFKNKREKGSRAGFNAPGLEQQPTGYSPIAQLVRAPH